jgi:hypothetical protein
VKRTALNGYAGGQHDIAGHVGSENMTQGEEAGGVDHSGNRAEQQWQPRLPARQLRCVIRQIRHP